MEKTDNEIIAEFMGIEVVQYVTHFGTVLAIVPEDGIIDWPELRPFIPDKDWNHLMPVVELINRMSPNEFTDEDSQDIFRFVRWPSVTQLKINTSLQDLYKAVIEFIKWYNTQPKQNGN